MRLITLGVVALLALTFVALVNTSVQADVENPSFETNDTSGWTETLNGATIEVVESCDTACAGSSFAPYEPVDGDYFALLTSALNSTVTLTQSFTVLPGATISGWAFFCDGNGEFNFSVLGCAQSAPDTWTSACASAMVAISNSPVFQADCTGNHTDWTSFTYVVPGTGCQETVSTLTASLTEVDGINVPADVRSRMGLDAIQIDDEEQVEACATPTPTATERPRSTPTATRPPNIGAGLSGLFQGQPTPLPTTPSVSAPAATAPAITPPRTGDGGLR